MKRKLLPAAILVFAAVFSLVVRPGSPGRRMELTARSYLDHLACGEIDEAYLLLSDSLGKLVLPEFLGLLDPGSRGGAISLKRWEPRGFVVYLLLDEGGNRTLWLTRRAGNWRISGDTSLDNVLGQASSICWRYAETEVAPALVRGESAASFKCPVTGQDYILSDEGNLICQAGHLGEGLDVAGEGCASLRDSLATMVAQFMAEGHPLPTSFAEMYEVSSGRFSQPGGFRCPDHGYSYYEIIGDSVFCPWHEQTSSIPGDT